MDVQQLFSGLFKSSGKKGKGQPIDIEKMGRTKASEAAQAVARNYFTIMQPGVTVLWTTLRAIEDSRFIVGVAHGDTIPPVVKFFAVSKADSSVKLLTEDNMYRAGPAKV